MSTTLDAHAEAPARRKVRDAVTPLWWGALVAIPLAIALIAAFLMHSHVESNLRQRVERSLLTAGVTVTNVEIDGRDVTAHVPSNSSRATIDSVTSRIHHVEGVRDVTVTP